MRVVVWIEETTWETCVQAVALLPVAASITLVHVAATEPERVATGARVGLLGRHPHPEPDAALTQVSEREGAELLALAQQALGRPAELVARHGRPEAEVTDAARDSDVLVVGRGGAPVAGPKSLGPAARFVVDHAPCPVLLVPGTSGPPGPPPHPATGRHRPHPPLPSGGR